MRLRGHKCLLLVAVFLCSVTSTKSSTTASSASTTTTSTASPTTSTAAPPTSTAAPTTSTAAPTTSTAAPTTSTAAPTTSTAAPTTSTAAPTTSTAAPTTSTAAPTTSTAVPTTSTAAPTTSTAAPTTSTAAPTTSTAAPTTSTAAPTTSTAAPTTSTAAPTTSTAAPTTSTAAPTTSTVAPTTSTAAPTTSTAAATTSTAAPATTSTATTTASTAASTTTSTALTTSTTHSSTTTTVSLCTPSYCQNGGSCFRGKCSCFDAYGGSRCELRRTEVGCSNRFNNEFIDDYRDINLPKSKSLFKLIVLFLIASFKASTNPTFRAAVFSTDNFVLIAFTKGSTIANYTMKFDTPLTEPVLPLANITDAMNSGIASYNASSFNDTLNITVIGVASAFVVNRCNNIPYPCSPHASCVMDSTNYVCTCFAGYRDDDPSVRGTKCTQECFSAVNIRNCSNNGICQANTGANATCKCFTGFSGVACEKSSLSDALLAVVILVPILFVIIVVVIGVLIYIYRKQGHFKRKMFDSLSHIGAGEDEQYRANPPSSAGSMKNSVRIPRAHLTGPEFGSMYRTDLADESGTGSAEQGPSAPSGFSYPYKRYSDNTFRSEQEPGPSRIEDEGRHYF